MSPSKKRTNTLTAITRSVSPSAVAAAAAANQAIPQIQADEIEALTSILGDDFKPLNHDTATPWGAVAVAVAQQPCFTVILRPDDETFKKDVWVQVVFKLPRRYPMAPLIITSPINPKPETACNVSSDHLAALGQALRAKANELSQKGDEAMWEVYSRGSEILSALNLKREQREENQRQMEAQRKSDLVLSLEEQKRQREHEGKKARAREQSLQRKADRRTTEEKASSLAKLISEREEAIRAERARRRVGFRRDDSSGEAGSSHTEVTKAMLVNGNRSQDSCVDRTENVQLFSPRGNHEMGTSTVYSPFLTLGSPAPVLLSFDPPLRLADSKQPVFRVQVSSAFNDACNAQDLASVHMAIPLLGEAQAGPPRRLFRIHVTSRYFSTSRGRRKLAGVEREIEALSQIRHPNIRPIEGYQLSRSESEAYTGCTGWDATPDGGNTEASILSIVEPPSKSQEIKLEVLLDWQPLNAEQAAKLARQLLSATQTLHGKGLLLKDAGCDRISLRRDHSIVIDGIWTGCVAELDRSNPLQQGRKLGPEPWSEGWTVPEFREELRYSRKTDAFVVGRLWLMCLIGSKNKFSDPWRALDHLAKIASNLYIPQGHLQLLERLLEKSQRKRLSVGEAFEHLQFVSTSLANASSSTFVLAQPSPSTDPATIQFDPAVPTAVVASTASRSTASVIRTNLGRSFFSSHPHQTPTSSRFLSDFVPLSVLGKGAFGVVTKVKNRLDGGVYAVKKIRLDGREGESEEKTLREIGALARVNHPHVTRYYAAWIEDASPKSLEESLSEFTSSVASATEVSEVSTPTKRTQAHSFSLSFGPSKDSDFDDVDQAEENDFLSHVGFEADESDGEDRSTNLSSEDENVASSSGSSEASEADHAAPRRSTGISRSRDSAAGTRDMPSINRSNKEQGNRSTSTVLKPRWLYIQMELVDNMTLREVVERGPLVIDDCWRFLRQILNALVHIHNLGIVHRDLKPSNILMSGADIKIGDFGLATTLETVPAATASGAGGYSMTASSGFLTAAGAQRPSSSSGVPSAGSADGGGEDMTGEVGTVLYAAPEIVKQHRSARYGYKVDMYSLGIIFFEMVASGRVYTTGMERVHLLRALRLPKMELPSCWPPAFVKEKEVVIWLVNHKPEERPTSLQLLQSELLPPRLEDESVQETLRLVTDPSSVYHLQLLDALFAPKAAAEEEIRDATFDAGWQRDGSNSVINPREAVVSDFLRMVFLRHGAVEMVPPLLLPPRSGIYSSKNGGNPVSLLDATGQVVQLPRDHLVPFARTIARADNHRLKRFCIGPVYRDSLLAGGQPMSILAANLDIIVGAGGNLPCAAEAECLTCLEEILTEVPGFKNDWVILINHGDILDLLLERVPSKQQASALALLNTLGAKQGPSGSLANARAKLTQQLHLSKSVIDELEACASMCDDIEIAHARLERIVPVDHRAPLAKAIEAVVEVRECARKFGVPAERRFLLSPLLSNYSQCYKGSVFFQVARATGGKKRRSRWEVVASGGRFSNLIARFAVPVSGPPPSGVGIQIAVSKLVHALAKDQEISELRRPPDLWTPRRADVYVHSGQGMLDARIAICRELWSSGIRADLSYEDDAGQESLLTVASRCKDEGFSYLVYLTRSIKVRSLWHRTTDVEFQSTFELMPWIVDQISRMLSGGGGGFGALGHNVSSDLAAVGLSSEVQAANHGSLTSVGTGGNATGTLSSGGAVAGGGIGVGGVSGSGVGGGSGGGYGGTHPDGSGLGIGIGAGAPAVMETQVVLPVQASTRQKDKSDRGNTLDRRIKLQSQHPIINSATREAHRMAAAIFTGEIPVIAVDLRGDHFDNLCSAAMAKETARRDVAWRAFFDTLGSEEREYAKNIRSHIERTQHGGSSAGQVMLFSIREKRCAVVGSTAAR